MDIETLLLISFFAFVIVLTVAIGIVIPFMIQIDVCGSDSSRDL